MTISIMRTHYIVTLSIMTFVMTLSTMPLSIMTLSFMTFSMTVNVTLNITFSITTLVFYAMSSFFFVILNVVMLSVTLPIVKIYMQGKITKFAHIWAKPISPPSGLPIWPNTWSVWQNKIRKAFENSSDFWHCLHFPGMKALQRKLFFFQLFFLNYAQIWCGSMRPEDALTKIRGQCYKTFFVRKLRIFVIS